MVVSLIVAMGQNREIGRDNDLMWHLPADMRFFRETTTGYPVIMGRKNWDSIPERYRPLANRLNIVLTRQSAFSAAGALVLSSIDEAIHHCRAQGAEKCFIIGGEHIYRLALEAHLVDEMYITEVLHRFDDAHAFFPDFREAMWKKEIIEEHVADEKHAYAFRFTRYTRA